MNELVVTSAKYSQVDGVNICIIAVIDGTKLSVPIDTANRHYKAIQDWVAEGNTIAPAD
tara:strand:+ start:339 stop:515 length:177 start_codon:yes stop_codon:yes gene_type:complete